jgi:hypothetical protein
MKLGRRWAVALSILLAAGLGAYWWRHFFASDIGVPPAPVKVEAPPITSPPQLPPRRPIHGDVTDRNVAVSNGDVHVRTMDGAYYDFQLIGEFVAVQSHSDNLQVQVRQAPWQGSSKTISTNVAVAMNVAGDRVGVYIGKPAPLYINGAPGPSVDQPIRLPNGGALSRSGNRITVVWPDETTVNVDFRGSYLDLSIALADMRAGKVSGLFGNFDGDLNNDLVPRNGALEPDLAALKTDAVAYRKYLYDKFGNSWRVQQVSSLFDYDAGESTETWTDLRFPYQIVYAAALDEASRQRAVNVCKSAGIDDERFLENCVVDVGVTGESAFTESSLQAQTDVLLPEGFECRGLRNGITKCTDYKPSLPEARIGEKLQITLETMVGDTKQVESFDCSPVDAKRRAACSFTTRGRVFEGSNTTERYLLESGTFQEEKGTMRPR